MRTHKQVMQAIERLSEAIRDEQSQLAAASNKRKMAALVDGIERLEMVVEALRWVAGEDTDHRELSGFLGESCGEGQGSISPSDN